LRIRSPFLTKLAAQLAVGLLRALFWTLRIELRPSAPGVNVYESGGKERYVFCTWHDSILMPIFSGRPKNMAALVSRHQDGSYLAEAMNVLGITSVRGSTNRGGTTALKQLLVQADDKHITITPDGPRGPRRQVKTGIVFLASHTGRAIVPMLFCCPRAWHIQGSWTDLVIPKPFSQIIGIARKPILVPPNLSREALDRHRDQVQAVMDDLGAEVDALAQQLRGKARQRQRQAARLVPRQTSTDRLEFTL